MAVPIIQGIARGRGYFQIAYVLLPSFPQAAAAWSATDCHRLDLPDQIGALIVQRAEAPEDIRRTNDGFGAFFPASKREARLQRKGGEA